MFLAIGVIALNQIGLGACLRSLLAPVPCNWSPPSHNQIDFAADQMASRGAYLPIGHQKFFDHRLNGNMLNLKNQDLIYFRFKH
ncbi:hypothetical protein BVC80_9099g226 [Macleaya cordata]|uniref:Uncharacterized protein n=1 Tax=Macleaya cordata TaxID=56857 RepID=A0A200PW37_MACCD|nr:hypothetical protein BVC80_9099g226 [Macleaya cordata]